MALAKNIVVVAFATTIITAGCTNREDDGSVGKKRDQNRLQTDSLLERFNKYSESEANFLLAWKYELDVSKVTDIIDGYLIVHHYAEYFAREMILNREPAPQSTSADENASRTIYRLSQENEISQQRVACVILDFMLIKKLPHSVEREMYVLLAIKHEVEMSKVSDIIFEYLSIYDVVSETVFGRDRAIQSTTRDQDLSQTINRLSVKHSISEQKVASVLFDYTLITGQASDEE